MNNDAPDKTSKNIFQKFSFYKSTFTIVHINGKKSKAGFPFIVKPAASDDRLGGFIVAEPVHDQQEYKSPPSVICLQKHRDSQQCQHADKLHFLIIPEVFQAQNARYPRNRVKNTFCFSYLQVLVNMKFHGISEIHANRKRFRPYFLRLCVCRNPSTNRKQKIGKAALPISRKIRYQL